MRRAAALIGLLALAACTKAPEEPAVARVNGEPITLSQVLQEQAFQGDAESQLPDVLEDLIDQALILQEGRRLGARLSGDDVKNAEALALAGTDPQLFRESLQARGLSYDDWHRRLTRAALIDAVVQLGVRRRLSVDRQEIQDHYWEHITRYRSPPHRLLRQIFTRSRGAAEAAERELELGEPFDAVARSRGQGPEAADGGRLGAVAAGQLPQALSKRAMELKAGQRSPILASHWGYHILYCEAWLPAQSLTLEEASPKAHATLLREKEQSLYQAWLAHLRESAQIEYLVPLPARAPADHPKGAP